MDKMVKVISECTEKKITRENKGFNIPARKNKGNGAQKRYGIK